MRRVAQAQAPAWAKLGKPLRLRFDKARATCHARTYDAAHLRAHPQQNVRRIAVLNPVKQQPAKDDEPNYQFVFRVEMKDGQKFEGLGNCAPDRYAYICNPLNPGNDAHEFYLTRAGDGIMLRDRKGVLADFARRRVWQRRPDVPLAARAEKKFAASKREKRATEGAFSLNLR